MKLQIVTVLIGLCGAAMAAPAHESRKWPIKYPGQDGEGSKWPIPTLPYATNLEDALESGLPFIPFLPPHDGGSEYGSPWKLYDAKKQDAASQESTAEDAKQ